MLLLNLLDGSSRCVETEMGLTVEQLLEREGLVGLRLVYQGSVLSGTRCLDEISGNLFVNSALEGGKKKKKKKVPTSKKKNKHIHKRNKLLTLKFYKVSGTPFITLLRVPKCHS
jgi:ubiquitin-small subunit ribosomal protein S27Ae